MFIDNDKVEIAAIIEKHIEANVIITLNILKTMMIVILRF